MRALGFDSLSPQVSDDVTLSWFAGVAADSGAVSSGTTDAWSRYLRLRERKVLASKDVTDVLGNTMRFDLGISRDVVYLFRRATSGFAEIRTGTAADESKLRARFDRAWFGP